MEDSADRKRFEEIDARLEAARPPGTPHKLIRAEIRDAIWNFRDELVEKYGNGDFHGYDWRREIAHLMEQCGFGLHSDIEREKRLKREEEIAARIAAEKAEEK